MRHEGITGTSYTHTGLQNGTTYCFVVTAVGPRGESAESAEVSATPEAQATHTLTVTVSGPGRVTSSPAGIDCGEDCDQAYAEGAEVTPTATPSAGAVFVGWSGDCSGAGSNPNATVTMDGNKGCTATFQTSGGGPTPPPEQPPPPLREETASSPTGSGELTFQVGEGTSFTSFDVQPFTGAPPAPVPSGYELPHGLYWLVHTWPGSGKMQRRTALFGAPCPAARTDAEHCLLWREQWRR
ncbi:MAG TPA: fibronectin type III domain-containing protein [Dehalococcoidia bacterium]|nr:fibronectin type III domain-containing protein [Dehalococcoidia bacterium]